MSYMEQQMQSQIDGSMALMNAVCDDACEIYIKTKLTPSQIYQQRAELLEALKQAIAWMDGDRTPINALANARAIIAKAEAAE